MAIRTPKTLVDWKTLTTTASASQYSVPSGTVTVINRLTFYNSNTTTVRTVTVNLVNKSGTTLAVFTKNVAPQKTWSCPDVEGHVLEYDATNTHKINAAVDAGTDVNMFLSGTEVVL